VKNRVRYLNIFNSKCAKSTHRMKDIIE